MISYYDIIRWYDIMISYYDIMLWYHIIIYHIMISYHDISYHDIISCYIISQHDISCLNITYHVLGRHKMSRKSTKCQKMFKNGFDPFKSNHFGFVLYTNTLRIHFWCILEAKSMVLWRFLSIFDKHVKNQFRLDGSTRNFMIRSTVMVKNCIDIIFEGLRDI